MQVDDIGSSAGRYTTCCRFLAIMAWPNDEKRRAEFLIDKAADASIQRPNEPAYGTMYREFGGRAGLLNANPLLALGEEVIKPKIMRPLTIGHMMINLLYRLDNSEFVIHEQSTVNKAAFLIEKTRSNFTLDQKNIVPKNASDILKSWGIIKPVAHFAAAYMGGLKNLFLEFGTNFDVGPKFWPDNIGDLLSISQHFYEWGTRRGILSPASTWQIPAHPGIPCLNELSEIDPLSDDEIRFLKEYRAAVPV